MGVLSASREGHQHCSGFPAGPCLVGTIVAAEACCLWPAQAALCHVDESVLSCIVEHQLTVHSICPLQEPAVLKKAMCCPAGPLRQMTHESNPVPLGTTAD